MRHWNQKLWDSGGPVFHSTLFQSQRKNHQHIYEVVVQVLTPLWKHTQGGEKLTLCLSMVHKREPLFAEDACCRNLSRKSPQFFSTCCLYSMAETNTYVSLTSMPDSQQNRQFQDSPNSNASPIFWKSPPSKTNTHYTKSSLPDQSTSITKQNILHKL